MPREERLELIKKIEEKRKSKVICYITGERPGLFSTKIADDAIRIFIRQLKLIGIQDKIDLFLYSRGGDMLTPLRLVRLLREHCTRLGVIIPYRAHSAATLIALGADEIMMGKLGELSPVDPTTTHPFNPPDPTDPEKKRKTAISVEDVTSYLLLAKERANIRDEQMVEIFLGLAKQLHPLALGNIYRGYRMVRMLAETLLKLHMDPEKEETRIKNIVNSLTERLCIHGYLIPVDEAEKEIKLNIKKPDENLENLLWSLYEDYEQEMQLLQPFEPVALLGGKESIEFFSYGAYIESTFGLDGFKFYIEIRRIEPSPGQIAAEVSVSPRGWEKID